MEELMRYRAAERMGIPMEVWVVCPRCEGCAVIIPTRSAAKSDKMVCSACGLAKDSRLRPPERGADPYFGLPLWFQAPCCGHLLWAYNPAHLAEIERFIRATLREGRWHIIGKIRTQSFVNKLPRWMKDGNNREDVLKTIEKLKKKV
jgi:hypothetical protein